MTSTYVGAAAPILMSDPFGFLTCGRCDARVTRETWPAHRAVHVAESDPAGVGTEVYGEAPRVDAGSMLEDAMIDAARLDAPAVVACLQCSAPATTHDEGFTRSAHASNAVDLCDACAVPESRPRFEFPTIAAELDASELLSALKINKRTTARKGYAPIMECVSLVVDGGTASLSTTDLECASIVQCAASGLGSAVVNLTDLMSALKGARGPVTFTGDRRKGTVSVVAGGIVSSLRALSPEDLPEIQTVASLLAGDAARVASELERARSDREREAAKPAAHASFRVEAHALTSALASVSIAAATERMRFALNGTLLVATTGNIEVVATDGRRLHKAALETPGMAPDGFRALLGNSHVDAIVGAWNGKAGNNVALNVTVAGTHAIVESARVSIIGRLPEGSFPNYRDVIPPADACVTFSDPPAAVATLRAACRASTRDAQSARLTLNDDGNLSVHVKNAEREFNATIFLQILPTNRPDDFVSRFVFGVNPQFLADAIEAGGTTLQCSSAKEPLRLDGTGFVAVVMPVSI